MTVENVKMAELLDRIDEDIHPFAAGWQHFFERVKENPDNYTLSKIGEGKRVREIGRHDIPKRGKVVRYEDNEGYDLQDSQFKKEFPELDTERPTAVVELVEDASLNSSGTKVVLKLVRYLIQETD